MSDDKYIEDHTSEDGYYEGGLINAKNIIVGSAIAAGSILAYKSGALKPIIKEMMKAASEKKPTFSAISNDLRKWFASDGDKLVEKSVFRLGPGGTLKEFSKFDKENAKEIIKHTKLDIQTYNKRLSGTLDDLMNNNQLTVNNTYKNTEIIKQITEADNAVGAYSHELTDYKNSLKSKMYDTIIKDNIQTPKQAAEKLKNSGYRTAELGDMFDIANEDGKIKLYDKTNFDFNSREKYDMKTSKEQLEEMLNSDAITESGIKITSNGKNLKIHELNDDFKHLGIDKSIHIDANDNIIDLRNRRESQTEFIRNLATEWQIPVISVNPLQMIGVDKIGRRKVKFATIKEDTLAPALTGAYGRSKENTIANVKDTSEFLKGVQEGVTIIKGDVFKINESGNGISKIAYGVKKNVTAIPKEFDHGTGFLTRNENAQRKQFGLDRKQFEEFGTTDFKGRMGKARYFKKKVADTLDLGHQEITHINEALDAGAVFAPDGFIQRIFNKVKPFAPKGESTLKTVSGLSDFTDTPKDNFFVTNSSVKLKDTISNFNKANIKSFSKQFVGNFSKDFESVTPVTSVPYFLTERLNGLMSTVGIGLSLKSTKSTGDNIKNIITKRFLPVYGAYQALNFINMFGEGGDADKPGNIDQHLKSAYVKTDVGLHKLADNLGITKMFKSIAEITPGSDMIGELPIVNAFTPSQTAEERANYWNSGYDPVRKGRYWSLNSTPFVGGKVSYWKPNMYRRALADAKYSDSLYGSRYEQYSNLLNPRHYDKKHYNTRPYLMTSPAFESVPIVGPILSGTVGKIVSPQRRMHSEYWNKDNVKSLQQIQYENEMNSQRFQQSYAMSQEQIEYNNQRNIQASKQMEFNSQQDLGYIMNLKDITTKSRLSTERIKATDSATLNQVFGFSSGNTGFASGINANYSDNSFNSSLVAATRQKGGTKQAYVTGSGATSIVQFNGKFGYADANKINKKGYTLGDIMNVDERATSISPGILSNDMIASAKMADPTNPNSIVNSLKNQFKNSGDVAGMYGFVTTDFLTGTPGAGETVIDTPGYSRSFNKTFWDQDLGGYGADISEIFRRLVQKRRTDQNYYNPVENRMPNWLPGENGFIDFKHGDAFCVSPTTLIETNNGYKQAQDIKSNDMVITHKSRYHDIKYIVERPILRGEEVYKFTISGLSKNLSPVFSEEHPIYIKKLYKCSFGSSCLCRPDVRNFNGFCDSKNCCRKWDNTQIEFIKAKDCSIGDAVVYPIPIIENEVATIHYEYTFNKTPRGKSENIIGDLNLTNDLSWLLGLYVAEGSTAKHNGKPMRLIFSMHSDESVVFDKIEKTVSKIENCKITRNINGNSTDIVITSAKLARIFNYIIPGNLYKKRIPKEIMFSSKENRLNFLLGFMLGDGTIQRNTLIGTSANRSLMLDFHKLCFNIGIPCNYSERNTRQSYELSINAFHLKDFDISNLLYKTSELDFNFKRQPSVKSWSDGKYIYSMITNIEKVNENKVIGFEIDDDDTFCVIGFATHNSKVSRGEERLPGEGYERLNHLEMPTMLKMRAGSSTIGKTKEEIMKHFLHQDELTDPELMKKINSGTAIHEAIEAQLLNSGVAIDSEIEIQDKKNGIIGYYDVKIHDSTSLTGEAIMDVKTVGADKLDKIRKTGKPVDYNQRQVNWYLHETNPLNKGYLYYVDREDPTNNYTVGFNYSHSMYKSTMNTLKQAREDVSEMIHNGQLSRGDLYDPVDRLRILGDVAPYSDEFKAMDKQISGMTLEEKDTDEVRAIRDRVAEQRKQTRFYDYRFKNNKAIKENAVIDRQIDNEKFSIKGSDTPIKLAGINFIQTDNEKYDEGMEFLQKHMGEGHKVQLIVAQDPTQRKNKDFLKTTRATVISDGMNINKQMIKRGYAQEDEKDFSAAGTRARFNGLQRGFGSAWENIAHADTFVNTKLLQVRTAKEDYERGQVYDKDFKSWTNPVKDFLKPAIWTNTNRNLLYGVGMGAAAGYMFGRTGFGKLAGSVVGVGTVLASKAYAKGYQAATDERWIPKEKRTQRDRDDYIDKLTFLKNRRLFEVYADKAKKENNFDVRDYLEQNKRQGDIRRSKANKIKGVKKTYQRTGDMDIKAFEEAGVKFDWKDKLPSLLRGIIKNDSSQYQDTYDRINDFGVDEKKSAYIEATRKRGKSAIANTMHRLRESIGLDKPDEYIKPEFLDVEVAHPRRGNIAKQWEKLKKSFNKSSETAKKKKTKTLEKTVNDAITEKTSFRKTFKMPENAMKAIEYYNASEATMYGYDPGEPLTNIMAAMPKKDKNYFREFLKAPAKDRKEILSMAPKYMRRALQSAYKMDIDPKENLDEYFSTHYLPGQNWDGWQENFDMKSMKVKMVQSQGESLQNNNLWQDDKLKADMYGPMPIPNMSYKTKNIQEVKNKLEDVLGTAGYTNLNFSFRFGAHTPSIDLDVYQSNKDKYDSKLRERLGVQ